ncbi:MAG: sodium:alanine symporter family protein [Oscillospiraceae bacterium]
MQGLTDFISNINSAVNGVVWGIPMMILIVGTGLFLSFRLGFLQFRKFGYAMKNTIGKIFHKTPAEKGAVSPFQAMTTALAATVGTGNIAGVAGAIALGGPGAVFWMWVSALVGMVTKYSEVVLAVKFRERNEKGDWVGGPMYYITNGLGKNWKWLAVIFAIFGGIAAFGIGNMTQVNTIAGSVVSLFGQFTAAATPEVEKNIRLIVGLIIASLTALVIIGGLKRIGSVTEKLVPIMSLIYIIGALIVVFANIQNIGPVMKSIFVGAFNPSAVMGGAVGIGIMEAMKRGVGRGVFSNEAGLGSAPIAHAATSETDPVKQGLFGIFEVFVDTIVICTLTALTVLMSGAVIPYGQEAGAELTISAFTGVFGGKTASVIITIGITLFASSTIFSWGLYGSRCAEYLMGTKAIVPYRILFVLFVVVGATIKLSLAWAIADTLNGLMAIPNLVALLGLSGVVVAETRKHFGTKVLK